MTYYQKNKDKIKSRMREYYQKNKEKKKEYDKKYQSKNRVLINEKRKKYYKKNLSRFKRYRDKYNASKKGEISQKIRTLRYLSKRNNVKFAISKEELKNLLNQKKCYYCNEEKKLEIDHKIPYSKNGETTAKNLVMCCMGCNNRKGTRTAEQFIKVI